MWKSFQKTFSRMKFTQIYKAIIDTGELLHF